MGDVSVLLTGDAGSGARKNPTDDIDDPDRHLGDIERHLVETHASLIDVDILQVGHHGSKTSSRALFLQAVSPSLALVSAGPKRYGSVVLPDKEVIDHLEFTAIRVLRTDYYDGNCPIADRVGRESDNPGGCSSYIMEW